MVNYPALWRNVGRDSSIGTAVRYRLDGPRTELRWWRDFPHCQTNPGTHLDPYTMRTWSFPWVKRTGRGVKLLPQNPAPRLKKKLSYTCTPPSGLSWPILGWRFPYLEEIIKFHLVKNAVRTTIVCSYSTNVMYNILANFTIWCKKAIKMVQWCQNMLEW